MSNQRYPIVTQSSNGYCPAQVTKSTVPQILTQKVGALNPTWEIPTFGRYYGTDSTNTNAYVITVPTDFTLTTGVIVTFSVSHLNTGLVAPTLNVNSTGAIQVVRPGGTACIGGEIPAGRICMVEYDGSVWRLLALPWAPVRANFNSVSGTQTVDCQGASNVYIVINFNGTTTLVLNNLAAGIPVCIQLTVVAATSQTITITGTNSAGVTIIDAATKITGASSGLTTNWASGIGVATGVTWVLQYNVLLWVDGNYYLRGTHG